MQKGIKNQKGITLIALVITIIVMLILVGVSVTVALNGGLFDTAKKASNQTKIERDKEQALANGAVNIAGTEYNTIDEYINRPTTQTPGTNPGTPGATEITFTLNWEQYTTVAGTTWEQWINTNASNDFYIERDSVVRNSASSYYLLYKGSEKVSSTEPIENGQTYEFINANRFSIGQETYITTATTWGQWINSDAPDGFCVDQDGDVAFDDGSGIKEKICWYSNTHMQENCVSPESEFEPHAYYIGIQYS